ncbi:YoaK family protein [Alysiella filiformis]|uniref:Uncharacterized membrane protein YoaK, UPF0700 family n=1 Tax=Alysiella filiformis DSM 16848 TaxID=1120981 RepID=A0A286E7G1_9NEIS|nr:YoaK family protein [Alysiella filiformis]QMT31607.1 DUF1275 domain-containing protein [Alysiella filiformis]UBQ55382.1 DUF1275 domain-containing protein [Alysiella filiformis DSM 16848]SOD66836.1 Uncharacterized membrane protein YoaK, UPF0700 family [Alysiella filiformis DSM 16848]
MKKTAPPRSRPFWQADKPYLDARPISDFRFRLLGELMALLAGAINAGGFFAVASYTSHVTGAISRAADDLVLGQWQNAATALLGVLCFVLGAAHAHWTVLWAKRHRFRSSYGLAMWLEAFYLLLFGFFAYGLAKWGSIMVSPTVLFLCWIMGMHNTVMSVLSGGAIRSTHMTGTATDLGVELAKALYYQKESNPRLPNVRVNRPKMRLLLGMMFAFLLGGVVGAWGYHAVGHHFTLPVAAVLLMLGAHSIAHDVKIRWRWYLRHRQ